MYGVGGSKSALDRNSQRMAALRDFNEQKRTAFLTLYFIDAEKIQYITFPSQSLGGSWNELPVFTCRVNSCLLRRLFNLVCVEGVNVF